MPHFHVRSKANPDFLVRLADCTLDHAATVVTGLRDAPSAPDDPYLVEVEHVHDDPPPPPRRRWWRRG